MERKKDLAEQKHLPQSHDKGIHGGQARITHRQTNYEAESIDARAADVHPVLNCTEMRGEVSAAAAAAAGGGRDRAASGSTLRVLVRAASLVRMARLVARSTGHSRVDFLLASVQLELLRFGWMDRLRTAFEMGENRK